MVLAITVPDVVLLYLAYDMPSELSYVTLCLSVESFGCGFGMAGFVRYLRYYGRGRTLPAYGDSCLAIVAFSFLLAGVATGFTVCLFFTISLFIIGIKHAYPVSFTREYLRILPPYPIAHIPIHDLDS